MSKRKIVTIETHEVWVIRRPKSEARGWCDRCATEVELLTADEASRLTGQSLREIFRRIELDQLHFHECPAGGISICRISLLPDQPCQYRDRHGARD
ncbi:MAG TPA: hypothetical protein PLD20_33905 [Blastocatellia bacterium]|nr:hypothetical protein [Blastocatellia bacterium]HMV87277.1 hypothetical protein [Blastocatellia bacterium]HMX27506.1 hypothetical protein [Blastocatellia bacterium]HMY73247.1 hypothetical protein [Blastocatellia bacterium]HMZ22968.1 hypothetical protein [Blastocatellia bacterium]